MESDILVDSNVYIDLLNAKKETVQVVFASAGERNLVICGVVRLELLRGIKSLKLLMRISAFTEMLFDVRADNS